VACAEQTDDTPLQAVAEPPASLPRCVLASGPRADAQVRLPGTAVLRARLRRRLVLSAAARSDPTQPVLAPHAQWR